MVTAGDEFGRTQDGNNNAYCQDNETSWVNWELDDEQRGLLDFFRRLTGFFHRFPILRRSRFLTGEMNVDLDVKDVTWIDASGEEMSASVWESDQTLCFGMLIDGRAQATGIKRRGGDATLLIVLNAYHDLVEFTLPACYEASGWNRLADTNDPSLPERRYKIGAVYEVTARSALLFERSAKGSAPADAEGNVRT
jgi:isoamylase